MHFTALVQLAPVSRAPRPALALLVRTLRRLRVLPGFRRWQTFRAMDASDALVLAVDWESEESLREALRHAGLQTLPERLERWGMRCGPVRILESAFDRSLGLQSSVATLARLSTGEDSPALATRDSELGLQALAAPGSTRVRGGRSAAEGDTALCRIDFDTEDGIWHFLQSPLRRRWSARAEAGLENETWAINLPRLEAAAQDGERAVRRVPETRSSLCVEYGFADAERSAWIRLQGRVDARGSARCEHLCNLLLRSGCRRLEVDVSDLARISPDALAMLARTARALKERGGQFVLTDNEERVKRVTRCRHLAASVR